VVATLLAAGVIGLGASGLRPARAAADVSPCGGAGTVVVGGDAYEVNDPDPVATWSAEWVQDSSGTITSGDLDIGGVGDTPLNGTNCESLPTGSLGVFITSSFTLTPSTPGTWQISMSGDWSFDGAEGVWSGGGGLTSATTDCGPPTLALNQTPTTPMWDLDLAVTTAPGCTATVSVSSGAITSTSTTGSGNELVHMPVFDASGHSLLPGKTNTFTVNVNGTDTKVDLVVPSAPIWIALGDSTSSGHHQDCDSTGFVVGRTSCYHPNDQWYSWVATAVATLDQAVPAAARRWDVRYSNLARSGFTSSQVVADELPHVGGLLTPHAGSWNIVSFTGGANDLDLEGTMKDYYLNHKLEVESSSDAERPWNEEDASNCPDTTTMMSTLLRGAAQTLQTNLSNIIATVRLADPNVRLVDQRYQYTVPAGNICAIDRIDTDLSQVTGATSLIDALNAVHAAADAGVSQLAVVDPSQLFGSGDSSLNDIQQTIVYGYPHVNATGQVIIGKAAAQALLALP
jgi:hypothetical protein